MRERAEANVAAAGMTDLVGVQDADILDLPYPDGSFDVVLAEAVTMFVNRPRAAAELARVCRPGGRVLATEFYWRRPPTEEARQIFLGEPLIFIEPISLIVRQVNSRDDSRHERLTGVLKLIVREFFGLPSIDVEADRHQ